MPSNVVGASSNRWHSIRSKQPFTPVIETSRRSAIAMTRGGSWASGSFSRILPYVRPMSINGTGYIWTRPKNASCGNILRGVM